MWTKMAYIYFPDRTYLYAEESPLIKRVKAWNIAHLRKRFMVATQGYICEIAFITGLMQSYCVNPHTWTLTSVIAKNEAGAPLLPKSSRLHLIFHKATWKQQT